MFNMDLKKEDIDDVIASIEEKLQGCERWELRAKLSALQLRREKLRAFAASARANHLAAQIHVLLETGELRDKAHELGAELRQARDTEPRASPAPAQEPQQQSQTIDSFYRRSRHSQTSATKRVNAASTKSPASHHKRSRLSLQLGAAETPAEQDPRDQHIIIEDSQSESSEYFVQGVQLLRTEDVMTRVMDAMHPAPVRHAPHTPHTPLTTLTTHTPLTPLAPHTQQSSPRPAQPKPASQ